MISMPPLRHIVAVVMFVLLAGVQFITHAQAPAGAEPVKVTFLDSRARRAPDLSIRQNRRKIELPGRRPSADHYVA